MARVRYAACMAHRAEAQKVAGVTAKQRAGLALGAVKGTNNRTGYKHREESKRKASESHKRWCAENPDKVAARGAKTRGERHGGWKGGSSRLNTSIRLMTENRRWMDAVKLRDGQCLRCGSREDLEAHHVTELSVLIARLGIKNRDDARAHSAALWDLANGETLCGRCHCAEHDRAFTPKARSGDIAARVVPCATCGRQLLPKPSEVAGGRRKFCDLECYRARPKETVGERNPNWRGGKVDVECATCGAGLAVKPAIAKRGGGKYCSRGCHGAARRKDLQQAA